MGSLGEITFTFGEIRFTFGKIRFTQGGSRRFQGFGIFFVAGLCDSAGRGGPVGVSKRGKTGEWGSEY